MAFRIMWPGDYYGTILRRGDGSWSVTTAQYLGRDKIRGYVWGEAVPAEQLFQITVLAEQLKAVGLVMATALWDERCVLTPSNQGFGIAAEGRRIKRVMSRNYAVFGGYCVHWSWEINQYS
jgi:hypothetical protein